jgi:hypothetical protein
VAFNENAIVAAGRKSSLIFFQQKGRALGDLAFAGKNGAVLALLSR